MKPNLQTDAKSDTLRWLRGLFAPTAEAQSLPPPPIMASPPPRSVPPNGQTILVVDDDPIFLRAMALKFASEGFEVLTACDASEAIQVARQKRPHLLVLDVNFPPDMGSGGSVTWDGFRIMSWLRRFDDFKITPIIITSIGDPVKFTRLAVGSGATAFFHKQMNPNQLLSIVNVTLARSGIVRAPGLVTNFQI